MDETPVITILYENDDVLVLDKPAGITVNRSATTCHEVTVQDWTAKKLHMPLGGVERSEKPGTSDYTSEEYFKQAFLERGGIVHRLDKETSGVLIVAKNWKSFRDLQAQFKERSVRKSYLALVHGKLVPTIGEIDVPVDRLPWNRRQFGIVAGGRPSVTLYSVVSYYSLLNKRKEICTLVELEPKTGRTHQIRVHMKYLNHPIFSDFLYGGRKISRDDRAFLPRVFLHAAKIVFTNPTDHTEITCESSLPKELVKFLEKLSVIE